MPINTNIETRMACFGKILEQNEDDCIEKCCFIEMDLCIRETKNRLGTCPRARVCMTDKKGPVCPIENYKCPWGWEREPRRAPSS